jgi:hypothetical protein
MAEIIALTDESIHNFALQINQLTDGGYGRVISSNAYYDGSTTVYYALVETFDNIYANPHRQILDKLDSIDSNLSSIESNTNN